MGEQAGSEGGELGARDRRHAPVGGIWATGRRWGRSQAWLGVEAGSLDSIRESDRTWQRG